MASIKLAKQKGESIMKKILCYLLAILMLVSLSACDLDTAPGKETSASQAASASKDETFGLNETAVFKTLKFTAMEIKESYGATYNTPESGKVFVGVKFTIENISDEDQIISSLLLFDAYADDVKCMESFTASMAFGSELLDGTIAPGKKLVGWYTLEVPGNWLEIELNVQSNWLSNSTAKFVFTK